MHHRPIRTGEATRSSNTGNLLVLVPGIASSGYAQQSLTFSPTGPGSGGTGTWNTSGSVWASGAICCQPWNNGAAPTNDAVFGGTAGTVTVSGTINVHHINFNTTGYNFTGGTLRLQGVTPTITANGGVTATIGSVFAGTAGLGKAGAGTIVLTGASTYSGGTTIGSGTLQVGSGGTAGTLGSARFSTTGPSHSTAATRCLWPTRSAARELSSRAAPERQRSPEQTPTAARPRSARGLCRLAPAGSSARSEPARSSTTRR